MNTEYSIHPRSNATIAKVVITQLLLILLGIIVEELLSSGRSLLGSTLPILQGLVVLLLIMADLIITAIITIEAARTRYVIRPGEVVIQRGLWGIQETIYKTDLLENIEVHQDLLGKLLGYGTIEFYHPILKQTIALREIPDPERFAMLIEQSSRKHQDHRQLHRLAME